MMTIRVPLTQGCESIIDDEDAPRVLALKWYASAVKAKGDRTTYYAERKDCLGNRKYKTILMHRFIMNADQGVHIDHINHNPLDNRRCNLRVATRGQNILNTASPRSKFGYFGVQFGGSRFYGRVQYNGKKYLSHGCSTAEEAARARDVLATKFFGEFVNLNFPLEVQEGGI